MAVEYRPTVLRSARMRTGPTRRKPFDIMGRTGLLELSGRVFDEWDQQLQGSRGRRAFREMADQDSTVGGMLFAFQMLIRQVHWNMAPADPKNEQAVKAAEFVQDCIHDMEETWPETLSEICSSFVYGWALMELCYKLRDGVHEQDATRNSRYSDRKIGWRSWAIRSQESLIQWAFDEENGVLGMYQMPPPDFQMRFVPMTKAVLFRHKAQRGNPEGISLLRSAYRDYYFKKNIETVEAIGAERSLVGFPVLYAPSGVVHPESPDAAEASDAYLKMLENMRVDEQAGALMPSDRDEHGQRQYELELLKSPGAMMVNTDTIIQRKLTGMAQSILADWMQLGHGMRGTQATSQSKVELFNTALAAILDGITATINAGPIPKLCRLNGINDPDIFPTLTHGEVARTDLLALGTFVNYLHQSGAAIDLTENSPLLKYLLEEGGLPPSTREQPAPDELPTDAPDTPGAVQSPKDPSVSEQNYANRPRPGSHPAPNSPTAALSKPPKPAGRPHRARNNST